MKRRILVIALSAMVIAGAVGGAGAALAATGNDPVEDKVAEELGVTTDALEKAYETADKKAAAAYYGNILDTLVSKGIITAEQRTEFETWANAEPQVTFTYTYTERFFGMKSYRGFADLDDVGAELGKSGDLLEKAYDSAYAELFDGEGEFLRTPPQEYLLEAVNSTESEGVISAADATALRNWINAMPQWLNSNDLYDKVIYGLYDIAGDADFSVCIVEEDDNGVVPNECTEFKEDLADLKDYFESFHGQSEDGDSSEGGEDGNEPSSDLSG